MLLLLPGLIPVEPSVICHTPSATAAAAAPNVPCDGGALSLDLLELPLCW
jgi:hypothetical protein